MHRGLWGHSITSHLLINTQQYLFARKIDQCIGPQARNVCGSSVLTLILVEDTDEVCYYRVIGEYRISEDANSVAQSKITGVFSFYNNHPSLQFFSYYLLGQLNLHRLSFRINPCTGFRCWVFILCTRSVYR